VEADGDSRLSAASRDATTFYIATRSGSAVACLMLAVILLVLLLCGVSDDWLIVISPPIAAWVVCDAVARAARRLDARCSHIEQLCAHIEERTAGRDRSTA
jgi:hypothetical protein